MRNRILAMFIATFAACGLVGAIDVATAPPAQAATEEVRNYCCDGSNYSFNIVTGSGLTQTLATGQGWYGEVRTIMFWTWECAYIRTSSGGYVYDTPRPGRSINVPDGAHWVVNPYVARNGVC